MEQEKISSLATNDSTVSCFSDYSVDAASDRGNREVESTDNGQEDLHFSTGGHLPSHANGILESDIVVENSLTESNNITDGIQTRDDFVQRANSAADYQEASNFYNDEIDSPIWFPPEPEDQEDDIEGSVANYDEDDEECGDGMKWGKPSSLSSFGEEGSGSYRFKEEKRKAMHEVMNGKFKALVSVLLKSMGISCPGNDSDSWVDTVTSLSLEAASFLKPDAFEGKAMDPDGYVKVKCIATGSRSQSEVFRGLVFKKHAAHKHMPDKCKKPRLLLIKDSLGISSNGLSSFDSMKQEKDRLDSIIGMIVKCRPNVVLVEKTVSRYIQESILANGMTLVLEMKLHRLERVASCTGSPLLSSDTLSDQKLKHCDSFHFEKIVEEHAAFVEGGKKPRKTLMFLEGCPSRLGCTILLKGSHSEELKRIKYVVQFAVVMAYHLILESSFLLDQRAMFSTISHNGLANLSLSNQTLSIGSGDANAFSAEESSAETDLQSHIDISISNGFNEEGSNHLGLEGDSLWPYEPYNPVVFTGLSSLSASLKKVVGDKFPLFSTTGQSMSTYFGFNGKVLDDQTQTDVQVLSSPEVFDNSDMEVKGSSDEEKVPNNEQLHSLSTCCKASLGGYHVDGNREDYLQSKDDISTVLNSESILVLLSRRNASRGLICAQSHFSCIKFYRYFDIPLGKFLHDNLLNQKLLCESCDESPEAHLYYYAHHNKQLTIQVKRLPKNKHLHGENDGKLWMWSCCSKCKAYNGRPKSTKRVLISRAACGLSFGKFLELGFSNHSSCSTLAICGHSLYRDFLHFFGLGSMVAMFRYSPVATYSVSLPRWKVEFSSSIRGEFLGKEIEHVYEEGISMFLEIESFLKKMESRFVDSLLNLQGSLKEFSDVEDMLMQERYQFEVDIKNTAKEGSEDYVSGKIWVYKPLYLNHVQWKLLLESFLWDQRLCSLLSSDLIVIGTKTTDGLGKEQIQLKEAGNDGDETESKPLIVHNTDEVFENTGDLKIKPDISVDANDPPIKEILIEGHDQGCREQYVTADIGRSTVVGSGTKEDGSSIQHLVASPDLSVHSNIVDENGMKGSLSSSAYLSIGGIVPATKDGGISSNLKAGYPFPPPTKPENAKQGIWSPFPEIQSCHMNDLQRGQVPNFEPINSYATESRIHKVINEEGSKLHIALGSGDYIVSDYEDELSSIIACALALLTDLQISAAELGEDTKSNEISERLSRLASLTSSRWSSLGSLDSDGFFSSLGSSSEETQVSSFEGELLDSGASSESLHPVLFMGRLAGKRKYSVACLYAKHFLDLRRLCGLSELDYIASLSRCRTWDAKGGKSKSFFAKTLDDRFIIKEIKKTEFYSFAEFALGYFKYMNQCFKLGNQTCLAKIFGIYQVRKRKTGTKHDLMVMENLTYSRTVSRQYDLKGALHARFNSAADGAGDVLLDQNFVNDMNVSPLYVNLKAKRNLERAVWNDTNFLNLINVMDYSLLVGVDAQKRELVCGIIDYVRQFTWDKQLENWVKSFVVPKNHLPTVISPREYKKRFRKFIDTHFLSFPDDWCSQRSLNPCNLCGTTSGYSRSKSQEQWDPDDKKDDDLSCLARSQ